MEARRFLALVGASGCSTTQKHGSRIMRRANTARKILVTSPVAMQMALSEGNVQLRAPAIRERVVSAILTRFLPVVAIVSAVE